MQREEEAKTKWCPFIRITTTYRFDDDSQGVTATNALQSERLPETCTCVASACMAWRWMENNFFSENRGYCGLAGRP